MLVLQRRFENAGPGHRWAETDQFGREKHGGGDNNARIAVLDFLSNIEPADVYTVDIGPTTVSVIYRKDVL